jgi:predicted DNA-binding transcriptional regulator AlpA
VVRVSAGAGGSSEPLGGGRLLLAEDVAAKLGTTTRWVYAETRAGRIPHIRLGPRYVRYREPSIDAWLAAQERGPIKAPGSRPGGFRDA